ncbi:MAG: NUDIX hydrolase, partial [Actinobacteria bacterium]|nr:NUDIX hydrolase [Actinomycetota bacterium]
MGVIQAAGAVLWRRLSEDLLQVALIHRPRYDDWSFPKGKVEAGEAEISCAHREVLEETGFDAVFGPELCKVQYEVGEDLKTVRYWSAQAIGEPSAVHDTEEVDQLIWVTVSDAYTKLSRKGDQEVLKNFEKFGADTTPLILLRHGKAIAREEWEGDDGDRPLAQLGQQQAKRMHAIYLPFAVSEIHSSDAVRCYETVSPMARTMSLNLVYWSELSEYAFEKDKKAAINVVNDIIESEARAIVCGHNPVIPGIVAKFIGKKNFKELDHGLLPGEAWILHHRDGEIVAIDWVQAPA